MSAKHIFTLTVFFCLFVSLDASSQDRTEKVIEKSSCFSSRIEFKITHCTPGASNGSIAVEFSKNVHDPKLFWFGFDLTKEAKNLNGLKPGYYSVMILDENNCKTRIDNIQVKEVQ